LKVITGYLRGLLKVASLLGTISPILVTNSLH
jgi:hypothetical protein